MASEVNASPTTQQPPDLNDPAEKSAWRTANEAAEKISSLYYRALDKNGRPDLPGFFTESATLLWNGNRVEGRQAIVDFIGNKLPNSHTTLQSLSAQPIQSESPFRVSLFGVTRCPQRTTMVG